MGFASAASTLRQPKLSYRKPQKLNGNVAESARLLGLNTNQFTAASLKKPSLFCQKPRTLHGNIAEIARLLGLGTKMSVASVGKDVSD